MTLDQILDCSRDLRFAGSTASSVRKAGTTRVPSSSIACISLACGSEAAFI